MASGRGLHQVWVRSEAGTTASRFVRRLFKWSHPDSTASGQWVAVCPLGLVLPLFPNVSFPKLYYVFGGISFLLVVVLGEGFSHSSLKENYNHWEKKLLC